MPTLWFDTETYCELDLFKVGTHAYAEHPSAEIMTAQWAVDDYSASILDFTKPNAKRQSSYDFLMRALRDPAYTIQAHNSHFDRTMVRNVWGLDIPVERWRDPMVKAMLHGLPGALGKLGPILGLPGGAVKDARGKALIRLFCKPRPSNMKLRRATSETHPEEWAEFLEYGLQDIPAMRAVERALPSWNYNEGHFMLGLWHLDQRINDRGFATDVDLAKATVTAVAAEQKRLKEAITEETDGLVTSPSKRDVLLRYILAEYNIALEDMTADTLRRSLEDDDIPEPVKLLMRIRLESTKASTAKYKALVRSVSKDGRLRNTLQFGGAIRTNRWAGRIFQPQNMPRPDYQLMADHFKVSFKEIDKNPQHVLDYISQGVTALKGGFAPAVFDNVMGLTANLVRGAIVAPPGRKLVIADLANIEGRGLACLAQERWKLDAFRAYDAGTGADLYNLAYARSFGVDTKDIPLGGRQIGKVQELGLGYEGGVAAFLTFAAVYNMDLDAMATVVWASAPRDALADAIGVYEWVLKTGRSTFGLSRETYIACELLKASWRNAHPETVALWRGLADATRMAVRNPGETFRCKALAVRVDGAWLRLRLPSGRYLCYLQPREDESGQLSYMGVNQYTRQWNRIKTYGGKLVENATQAWALDVLAHNLSAVEGAGYEIVLTAHDEIISETPDSEEFNSAHLAQLMSANPPWAADVPLAAAGFETTRYRKG